MNYEFWDVERFFRISYNKSQAWEKEKGKSCYDNRKSKKICNKNSYVACDKTNRK